MGQRQARGFRASKVCDRDDCDADDSQWAGRLGFYSGSSAVNKPLSAWVLEYSMVAKFLVRPFAQSIAQGCLCWLSIRSLNTSA